MLSALLDFFGMKGYLKTFNLFATLYHGIIHCSATYILSLSVERTFEKSRGLPFVVTMVLLSRRHEFGTENIHK